MTRHYENSRKAHFTQERSLDVPWKSSYMRMLNYLRINSEIQSEVSREVIHCIRND